MGLKVWNFLHVILLAPRVSSWLVEFVELVHPWLRLYNKKILNKFLCLHCVCIKSPTRYFTSRTVISLSIFSEQFSWLTGR